MIRKSACVAAAVALTGFAFQFGLMVETTVTLLSPGDLATTVMPHPHFQWLGNPSADRYEIQISTDEHFQTLEDSDSVPVPRYVPLDALHAGTYWWRVRPAGGAWSQVRRITVNDPGSVYVVSTNNSMAVITNTIAAAAENTPSKLLFETGIYRVALPDDTYLFGFENVRDLIVDGQGSLLVFDNNNSGCAYFSGCKNILLRDFDVDYTTTNGIPTTHTAGTVVSMDSASGSFVFQPLEDYLPPDDPRIRDASGRRWGCLMDTNTPGRLKFDVPNWYDFQPQVDDLGGNQYRLYLIANHTSRLNCFEVGDVFVKSAIWGDYVMYCTSCTNITYEGITSYAGSANHFIGNWNDGVHFLRCASRIKEGRLVSNGCGGYVGSGYETGFWIEECLTEGMFDDAVNCNNGPSDLLDQPATNQILTWGVSARETVPGDTVSIFTATAGFFNGKFIVEEVELLPGGRDGGGGWLLTLDGDVGEVDPGLENWNSKVYLDRLAHTHAYVRNCTFRNSRRFGTLFKSHGGVVEGCTFEGLSEAAVQCENETASFDGGLECRDVRILSNTIINCGYSSIFLSQRRGTIQFAIDAYQTNCTQQLHTDIEIAGNQIFDWEGRGISVQNAHNVQIVSNAVTHLNSTGFVLPDNYGIYLNHVHGAEIVGNDLRDARAPDAAIFIENSTTTWVENNQE